MLGLNVVVGGRYEGDQIELDDGVLYDIIDAVYYPEEDETWLWLLEVI